MAKTKIYRGGVIPYRYDDDGELQMLFMKPADPKHGGEAFQLAKGKVEEGEDIKVGAFREAREELGLFEPNTTNHKKVGQFLGRMTIYVAEVINSNDDNFGQPHFETDTTKWMTSDEFQEIGRDLHKPVVKAAVRTIERSRTNNRKT